MRYVSEYVTHSENVEESKSTDFPTTLWTAIQAKDDLFAEEIKDASILNYHILSALGFVKNVLIPTSIWNGTCQKVAELFKTSPKRKFLETVDKDDIDANLCSLEVLGEDEKYDPKKHILPYAELVAQGQLALTKNTFEAKLVTH